MEDYIKGTFKTTIFRSDKGYVIGLFKVSETNIIEMQEYLNKQITITGYFADLNEGEKYILYGECTNHPKYGFQYNVKSSEKLKPSDKDGIIEFLSSNLFKGIGEKLAEKIVNTLGLDALDLIINDKKNSYKLLNIKVAKICIRKYLPT